MTTQERQIDIDSLPPAAPRLLTPLQVARRLQISERNVRDLLNAWEASQGERGIRGVRIGKLWRVEPEEIEAYILRLKGGVA
jgi:hypothetical protein